MLKKLPLGIQNLPEIINDNYIYIDKTDHAFNMITKGKYYFLSRPRRFGKSLFLDTLRMIFSGEKELFKDLYIYDKYDFQKHPVIRISFNDGKASTKEEFKQNLYELLNANQRHLGISCPDNFSQSGCFKRLIEEAYLKYNQKVVILIDEYDKPILDNIEDKEIATLMREELKNFYSVIKGADEYLKFVFITGVSKFSKVSLFSGLNNLDDITLDPNYATICGYTQNDINTTFAEHLKGADFNKIREWYNGYKWLGDSVYNPFDILLFISKNQIYRNYWFSTATPTFLLKLIEKNNYFLPDLENITKNEAILDSFDVDCIELETLMWQTGYLTISETKINYDDTLQYILKIPNKEVKVSLMSSIAHFISKIQNGPRFTNKILEVLFEEKLDDFEPAIKALFAAIPYNNFTGVKLYEYEGYYVSVFYAYMKGLGIEVTGEDVTNKGRIDLTVKTPHNIYIIEFKTDGNDALKQIKDKKYYEKYLSEDKKIYLVGIEFDIESRNVSKLEWDVISNK